MQNDVVLTYRRAGETYQGNVDGQSFSDKDFTGMMSLVHLRLVSLPEAGLIMQRTDREGLLPVRITSNFVEMLRTDPVQYIRMHSVDPVRIDLTAGGRTSALAAGERVVLTRTSGIRAGQDTIAAAFGELIYLRVRSGHVESPDTGRWVTPAFVESWLRRSLPSWVSTCASGWVGVKVTDLLATGGLRFYLPREWNPHGSWITNEQLSSLLEQFMKERSALCQSAEETMES